MYKYLLWLFQYKIQFVAVFLVIIGFYFRFHNFPVKYAFDFDPSRDALIAYYGARNFSFPLIGAASGLGAFSFGPWYYWQIIIISLLVPSLWAPWIYIGLFSMAFLLVMYKIGELLEDNVFGLILLFLATVSPAQIGPTAGLSNPNLVPLHAALTIYFALLFIKKHPPAIFAFMWGVVIGVGINNHFQMLMILIVPFLVMLVKREAWIKRVLLFCLGFFITFLPIIIFNILTQWETLKEFSTFLLSSGNTNYVPNSWKIYLFEFWPQFFSYVLGIPQWLLMIILTSAVGIIIYQGIKRKLVLPYWILGISFFCIFVVLRYYSGERQYYYLLFLHPFLFVFTGYPLYMLIKNKMTLILSLILLIAIGFFTTPQSLQRGNPREENIRFRKIAEQILVKTQGKPVALYNCGKTNRNRAQGVAFFLLEKGVKLDIHGIKVGIANGSCFNTENTDEKNVSIQLLPESLESKWVAVTPENVYKETVGWWY